MTWDITDRFPDWGETGESPPTGFFYEGGDQVNEKHLDYLWNSVKGLEDDVQSALNDIDSDGDGKVDSAAFADSATNAANVTSTYKGNDIDSDGDGKVDTADTATSISGVNYSELSNVTKIKSGQATLSAGNGTPVVIGHEPANNSNIITGIVSPSGTALTDVESTYGLNDDGQQNFPYGDVGYLIQTAPTVNGYSMNVFNFSSVSVDMNYAFYEVEK